MSSEVEKLVNAGKLSPEDGEKLSILTPGTFVVHKSWGAGQIAEWNLLEERLVVDFEEKEGHTLKLGFAIGSLEVLDPKHLLARRVGKLKELLKLVKENPVQFVVDFLKCHDNKSTIDQLEKFLVPRVLTPATYKSWWTATKKVLKDKRHIVVPSKRTEPLVLREEDASLAATILEELQATRELKSKVGVVSRLIDDLDLVKNPQEELQPIFDELSQTVRKSWRLNLKDSLHLLVARDELADAVGVEVQSATHLSLVELLRENREVLTENVNVLPAKYLGRVYRSFPAAFTERQWVEEMLKHLTRTGGRCVAEIASVMDENDEIDVLSEFLKKAVRNRQLSTDLMIWMCKERKGKAASVFDLDLGNAILSALENDHMDGGPKRTGRLSDAFTEDISLLSEMVVDSDLDEIRLFTKRIMSISVFDELTRRSLMGRLIKARPEVQELMSDDNQTEQALMVSWPSLERRKADLEDLVKNKIPQNKRDIQIAREYGDLRENFEYKSAREQQAVLLRLQSKYEREVRIARATDFAGVNAEIVSMGTIVELEDVATGSKEVQTILGAWDADPDNNILSYLSEMAKMIIGKRVGEEAEVPTETSAMRKVRVVSIKPYVA